MKVNKTFFLIAASSIIPSVFAWYALSNEDYYGAVVWSILSYALLYVANKYRK